ncbi:hypothetical protein ACGE24_07630 [Corynebacterium kroppenstedtii]|uniref:hypothetical protein n=1 Tax=Corynebacterium sp. PCR 32 TaxID=3351342 RepID=UPI0030B3E5EE
MSAAALATSVAVASPSLASADEAPESEAPAYDASSGIELASRKTKTVDLSDV